MGMNEKQLFLKCFDVLNEEEAKKITIGNLKLHQGKRVYSPVCHMMILKKIII